MVTSTYMDLLQPLNILSGSFLNNDDDKRYTL